MRALRLIERAFGAAGVSSLRGFVSGIKAIMFPLLGIAPARSHVNFLKVSNHAPRYASSHAADNHCEFSPLLHSAPVLPGCLPPLPRLTPKTAWNNDDLADDVATLSYEHALRTHARYSLPMPMTGRLRRLPDLAAQTRSNRRRLRLQLRRSSWAAPGWGEDAEAKPSERHLRRCLTRTRSAPASPSG